MTFPRPADERDELVSHFWLCAYCDYRNRGQSVQCEVCEASFGETEHRILEEPSSESFASAETLAGLARRVRNDISIEPATDLRSCLAKADELLAWLLDTKQRYQMDSILKEGIPIEFLESLLKATVPNYVGREAIIDYIPRELGKSSEIVVVSGPSGRRAVMWRLSVPSGYECVG